MMKNVASVDDYIAGFPEGTQKLLIQLRDLIRKAAPAAEEGISYQIPAYKYHGMLVYFAGYEKHVGFYPTPSAIKYFAHELAGYKTSKGAVQLPLDEKLPSQLIRRIVRFRLKENEENAEMKIKPKKRSA